MMQGSGSTIRNLLIMKSGRGEIPINLTAQEVFVDSGVFTALQNIVTYLENNDTQALSENAIGPLQDSIDQVLACRSKVWS